MGEFRLIILPWNNRLSDQVQHRVKVSSTSNQARSKGLDAGTYYKKVQPNLKMPV